MFGIILTDKSFSAEIKSVNSVYTCDSSGNRVTYFRPGDDISYKVDYTLAMPVTAVFLRGVVEGDGYQETLPWQFGILNAGTHTTTWDSEIPSEASGTAFVQITYIGLIDEIVIREATFSIGRAAPDEPSNVGNDKCKMCHPAIYENLIDSSHGFIDCESCHGPGSKHLSSPSAATITVDTSSSLCGQCHTRGDDINRIESEDGLIKRNQQYDELLSGGKGFFKCVRCHDPHISIKSNPEEAVTAVCSECHTETISSFHEAAQVECIDCHMPFAVKDEASFGEGDHLKGDTRSHIFSVDTFASPPEMFYQEDGKTFAKGFLTLNFVCLGCHDGSFGREHDFGWAEQAAGLIHSD
jgi:predicted CXXCH cytochrome family protein